MKNHSGVLFSIAACTNEPGIFGIGIIREKLYCSQWYRRNVLINLLKKLNFLEIIKNLYF